MTGAADFFSTPSRPPYTRADVLAGRVVKVSPALITLTDGLVETTPANMLQTSVRGVVGGLLARGVRSFHADVNFPDYGGFGEHAPDINTTVFTPAFLRSLQWDLLQPAGAFLTLHLTTDHPLERLRTYGQVGAGAVCFQLDAVPDHPQLIALIARIQALGACASPVVETVGTGRRRAMPPAAARARLAPVLGEVGMLTFQAAATGARSNATGRLDAAAVRQYLAPLRARFEGTVQLQGGITRRTVTDAVRLGADFLVCGTDLFHSETPPGEVIDAMLAAAADVLAPA